MVEFQKGIPFPKGRKGKLDTRRGTLLQMEVGDSFRVEAKDATAWKSAANNNSKDGRKYSVRIYEDAYRLWRIE